MKNAVVFLSLALVFLAVVEVISASPRLQPGEVEVKGKQSKSSSDVESCSSDQKTEAGRVGGLSYVKGSQKNEYSQDYDSAAASEKEETLYDDFGNAYKSKSKSSKSSSVDVDGESSSTYTKYSV